MSYSCRIGKTAVIYPSAFLIAAAVGMIALGIIFFADEFLHATPGQIGCLGATYSLCYFMGCLFIRPIFAQLLPRHSMAIATTAMGLAILSLLGVESLISSFVCYGTLGLASTLFWPPMMGWLSANIEGKPLNRAMRHFNLCWSAGAIMGPMLAGLLSEIWIRLPIACAAALCLADSCLILAALSAMRGLDADDNAHVEEITAASDNDCSVFIRFPSWAGLFVSFGVLGAVGSVIPISAQRELAISKTAVGALLLTRAFATSLGLWIMGSTSFWHFRYRHIIAGIVCLGLVTALLAVARSALLLGIVLSAMGLLVGQSYTSAMFHGISGSMRRSARMTVHESLVALGAICGSASGGIIYQRYGNVALWLLFAGVLFVTAAIQLLPRLGLSFPAFQRGMRAMGIPPQR